MNNYLIYKHTSPSGKAYIGQTNNYAKRCDKHKRDKACRAFANAISHYGWDSFTHEILHSSLTIDEANTLEALCIAQHNTLSPYGYNLRTGGLNSRPSEETRAKMSATAMGKIVTPETRAKMVLANKNRSLETRNKHLVVMSTPEVRAKMSAAHKGKIMSPEARAKIALANKNRIVSPETRAKISAAQKNRIISPEVRAKHLSSLESIVKRAATKKSNTFTKMQTAYLKITLTEQQYAHNPLGRLLGVTGETIKSHFQTNPVTAQQVHDYFNQPNPYTT